MDILHYCLLSCSVYRVLLVCAFVRVMSSDGLRSVDAVEFGALWENRGD